MREKITDAQWTAARALVEGESQTHARVAACLGIHVTTVSHRASEYDWASLDFRHPRVRHAQRALVAVAAAARAGHELDSLEELDEGALDAITEAAGGRARGEEPLPPLPQVSEHERARRLRSMLQARMEEMLQRAEAGRPVESRQVLVLTQLAQLAEKLGLAVGEEYWAAEEARSDESVRDIIARIDAQILTLGRAFAVQILTELGMSTKSAKAAVADRRACDVRLEDGVLAPGAAA